MPMIVSEYAFFLTNRELRTILLSINYPCSFDSGRGASWETLRPLLFLRVLMRTYIYIDGFNFYYGAVKNTPYKWLDFKSFFQKLLNPQHDIIAIKYFTAHVTGKLDPRQPVRQKTYLRALQKHIPELSVHLGHFSTQDVLLPLSWNHKKFKDWNNSKFKVRRFNVPVVLPHDRNGTVAPLSSDQSKYGEKRFFVPIIKTEEKGSDVNIAVHLLNDSWLDKFDCAIVVSNDSDLAESLRLVSQQNKKKIGLINPRKTNPSRELMKYATFHKKIRTGILRDSQLPSPIPGTNIKKPEEWLPKS